MLEEILKELSRLLYGGDYEVHFDVHRTAHFPNQLAEAYVYSVYQGKFSERSSSPVSSDELLKEFDECVRHPGDSHYGPDPEALKSKEFNDFVAQAHAELRYILNSADTVARITFEKEHPAYPVYWDFAFVIAGPVHGGMVLVGCSSD